MNKKYYWLKLHNDFFRQLEIKKLRTLENGDLYTLIYLKLQLLSITTDGQLFSLGAGDSLAEDLALAIDEKFADVEKVLFLLEKYHLLKILDEECLLLTKVAGVIGSEGASTERVRRMRVKNSTPALQCNNDVTKSNTEKELELKIEIDKEINESRAHTGTHTPAYYEDKIADKLSVPAEDVTEIVATVQVDPKTALTAVTDINNLPANVSASKKEAEFVSIADINTFSKKLSVQQNRLAEENFSEKDPTMLGIQAITARLLARLKTVQPVSNLPLAVTPAVITENSFEDFWRYYPKSYDRNSTFQVWLQTLAQGIAAVDLVCAAKNYTLQVKSEQTLPCYITSSRNFFTEQ